MLRLVLALVVVLLVMRQAAQPELYHVFFPSGSVPYRPHGATQGPPEGSPTSGTTTKIVAGENSQGSSDEGDIPPDLQRELETVVDGSTWRGGDLPALQWMRKSSDQVSMDNAEPVSVLPLLQQSEQYQGRRVYVRGTVARTESVQDYFHVWLKPDDGSNRPILAIVNDVPDKIRSWNEIHDPLKPRVVIAGRFLKRLAYRSGKGADVAPVVVGRIDRISADFLNAKENHQRAHGVEASDHNAWWIVAVAVVLGVTGTGILAWRQSRQRDEMRRRRRGKQATELKLPGVFVLIALGLWGSETNAQSLAESLGRFDRRSLEAIYPLDRQPGLSRKGQSSSEPASTSELAKLLYQLQRLSTRSFRVESTSGVAPELGEACRFEGQLVSAKTYRLPESLADVLDMSTFQLLTIQKGTAGKRSAGGELAVMEDATDANNSARVDEAGDQDLIGVFTAQIPRSMKRGDRISGAGVSLLGNQPEDRAGLFAQVIAAPRVSWTPNKMSSQGWVLLDQAGFDLSRLDEVRPRQRQPLHADDSESFFEMLAASGQIETESRVAKQVPLVDLLSRPDQLTGDWIRLRVDAIRVTRVKADNAADSLGQDHYFQIDAVGDLGNVIVKIEAGDDSGNDLELDGRFPVSIVTTRLPKSWLSENLDESAVSAKNRRPVWVDGFFYRLWSYESDLSMRNAGSSDQIGPLIMATNVWPVPSDVKDPVGVYRIGWAICACLIVGMLMILGWQGWNRRSDKRAHESRGPMTTIDLPE